jgi:hypothetical protein
LKKLEKKEVDFLLPLDIGVSDEICLLAKLDPQDMEQK